jgi:hypothetical protein
MAINHLHSSSDERHRHVWHTWCWTKTIIPTTIDCQYSSSIGLSKMYWTKTGYHT